MNEEQVVLVDSNDNETGVAEKLEAHRSGALHRAVSVFIYNSRGELLIHKRADEKYHSAGLWTNTCCSHPRPGEQSIDAARRRLKEEMGLDCELKHQLTFTYRAEFENGLTEHELDHVFVGFSDAVPVVDPREASEWKYISGTEIAADLINVPHAYTVWFRLIYPELPANLNK